MQPFTQFDSNGRLRHLISLRELDGDLLRELLDRAQHFLTPAGELHVHGKELEGFTVANMFSEPSTRTRVSFELAALRLGADVVNLDVMLSSRVKGESMLDTIYTLQAMQVDVFVMRDSQPGVTQYVAEHVDGHVSVVSGGEAHLAHPTQGLLDALTIHQFKGGFRDLVVAIVGDIRHSRVARSAWHALSTLGVGELRLIGPDELMPPADDFEGAVRFESFDQGVDHADVVMMLRIQSERMEQEARIADADRYFERYGLTGERLRRARPEAIVMHPGPMNRGIEIESALADSDASVITRQVGNGVAVRMAILERVCRAMDLP
jgi:aspartate carbamoyltransferase catalytic subunit